MRYSIITPVFNRADCVTRCIDSVIRNIKQPIELEHIIVDDGSTDETPIIIKKYINKYTHIKFIPFANNKGTNAARNAAINMASGTFCIILDSDDYFLDNAIGIIEDTLKSYPKYMHYTFAADDMMEYYNNQALLKGSQSVITFEDFLNGRIGGDFIHVIKTETLKKYPFDENLRIHEGVFFLQFYKQAQKLLFTKTIVTIRERNRQDSVTRDVLLMSNSAIQKTLKAVTYKIKWFSDDLKRLNCTEVLRHMYQKKIECSLMLSDYENIKFDINSQYNKGNYKALLFKIIFLLHLGYLFKICRNTLVKLKYKILENKIK